MSYSHEIIKAYIERLLALKDELKEQDLRPLAQELGFSDPDWQHLQEEVQDHVQRGSGFLRYDNWKDAMKEFTHALELNPFHETALKGLMDANHLAWRQTQHPLYLETSLGFARKLLQENPGHDTALRLISEHQKTPLSPPPPVSKPILKPTDKPTPADHSSQKLKNELVTTGAIILGLVLFLGFIIIFISLESNEAPSSPQDAYSSANGLEATSSSWEDSRSVSASAGVNESGEISVSVDMNMTSQADWVEEEPGGFWAKTAVNFSLSPSPLAKQTEFKIKEAGYNNYEESFVFGLRGEMKTAAILSTGMKVNLKGYSIHNQLLFNHNMLYFPELASEEIVPVEINFTKNYPLRRSVAQVIVTATEVPEGESGFEVSNAIGLSWNDWTEPGLDIGIQQMHITEVASPSGTPQIETTWKLTNNGTLTITKLAFFVEWVPDDVSLAWKEYPVFTYDSPALQPLDSRNFTWRFPKNLVPEAHRFAYRVGVQKVSFRK
ncbi:MAG: hypothetical protein AAFR61_20135 [Bacteroidota bacterium]